MSDVAGDPMVRIAAALEILPALREGQAAMVNNLEALMAFVEQQKAETSSMNERIAGLARRIQQLEDTSARAPASTAGGGDGSEQSQSQEDKPAKCMRGAVGKARPRSSSPTVHFQQ